jgi:hypothetical protein
MRDIIAGISIFAFAGSIVIIGVGIGLSIVPLIIGGVVLFAVSSLMAMGSRH